MFILTKLAKCLLNLLEVCHLISASELLLSVGVYAHGPHALGSEYLCAYECVCMCVYVCVLPIGQACESLE